MRISVFCLTLNLLLVALLVGPFGAAGMAVSNTLSSYVNIALLVYALKRKLRRFELGRLWAQFAPALGAALIAAVVAWALAEGWVEQLGHATVASRLGGVFVPAAAAGFVYLGICLWARVSAARDIVGLLRR
jgi:peptidoglycan biosynthesis protein MviN/MurJ (putative lipid II flippase)